MYVLDQLWRGEITPSEKSTYRDSDYHRKLLELCQVSDRLSQSMTDEEKKTFKNYTDIQAELSAIENQDTFIQAFRLGAQMILDVVSDYRGQFYT